MLDPTLTDDDVRAVIEAMLGEEPELGHLAELVWDSLTAGEGPEVASLAGLANWLWWLLPKRSLHEPDLWSDAARAGAELFERLGADSYVEMCRSEITADVHARWRRSPDAGVKACRKALAASGLEPPDLVDFAWSEIYGTWEAEARDHVERALEAAIDNGRLDPGRRGWRATAQKVCAAALDDEHPTAPGQSYRTLVASERAERWVRSPQVPAEQQAERAAVVNLLIAPPERPDPGVMAEVLGPLVWLVQRCEEGVTLTGSHYLPPAVVREAVERFGWWDWDKPPRSEADVPQLETVRETARRMGLVRRRGRTLSATKRAVSEASEPSMWWPGFVATLGGEHDHEQAAAELVAMGLLDGQVRELLQVEHAATQRLAAQPWRMAGDDAVPFRAHRWAVGDVLYRWRTWGLTTTTESRWEPGENGPRQVAVATVALSPGGQAAVAHWLHLQVCGPRPGP